MGSLSSHHLLDHNLGQLFASKGFVHGQEVCLAHFDSLAEHIYLLGLASNHCHYLVVLFAPHAKVQVRDVTWSFHGPSQLLLSVVQSEVSHVVFNVVFSEERRNFLHFLIIFDVKIGPFETWRQSDRFFWNVIFVVMLDWPFLVYLFSGEHNRLRFPKLVRSHDPYQM